MDSLIQDLRYAFRQLVRHRGFTALAVLTLAFGIGANTAVFTLVNGALFRPPRVQNPGELAWVTAANPRGGFRSISYPDYRDLRDRVRSFAGAVAWNGVSLSLGGAIPERVRGLLVTSNYFDVLGVRSALGRGFHPA